MNIWFYICGIISFIFLSLPANAEQPKAFIKQISFYNTQCFGFINNDVKFSIKDLIEIDKKEYVELFKQGAQINAHESRYYKHKDEQILISLTAVNNKTATRVQRLCSVIGRLDDLNEKHRAALENTFIRFMKMKVVTGAQIPIENKALNENGLRFIAFSSVRPNKRNCKTSSFLLAIKNENIAEFHFGEQDSGLGCGGISLFKAK